MHAFQRQNTSQTLAAGMAEYHAANPGLAAGRSLSPQAREFFRCHDAVHVVYGCGTTLDDEAVVKIASMLGTTAGLSVLRGYTLHESLEIYRALRVRDVLVAILHAAVIVPRTAVRCLRQRRRWPWQDFEPYMQRSLRDIRQEFGVRVAHFRADEPDA
jgi:hypothetical protein